MKSDHHSSELLSNMNLQNLFTILELFIAKFMYKAFHQLSPYNLQMHFIIQSIEYGIETKRKDMFRQSYVRTTKKQHCISVFGV